MSRLRQSRFGRRLPGARLGSLERAVMERLWQVDADTRAEGAAEDTPGLTVREILDGLDTGRPLAYTTVMTVLDRLCAKGIVDRRRDGRAWRYWSVQSSEQLTADLLRDGLSHLDSADRRTAMLHFLDGATEAEIDDLKRALAELESRRPDTGTEQV